MASAVSEAPLVDATTLPTVTIEAPEEVQKALRTLGRTEDLKLAPGRRRLAIACLTQNAIAIADVDLARTSDGPRLAVTAAELIASPGLHHPHGIDWLDDETLVVGNRDGNISVLAPHSKPFPQTELASPLLDGPGSLVARNVGSGRHELLVCNNWANTVTRHVLEKTTCTGESVALARWVDLPDSIALSDDARWLAVSSHNTHCVLVFDYTTLDEDAVPAAVLRGVRYPHGLRFTDGGAQLVVADAGAPVVHLFATQGRWSGVAYPAATLRVMDDETFRRGHQTPQEGGPKGLDVDSPTNLLLITSEHTPLACFDLARVAATSPGAPYPSDGLLDYELLALSSTASAKADSARTHAQLQAVLNTKAWRLTAAPRRVYGVLRGVASRRRTASSSTSSDTSSGASETARSASSA